MKQVYVFCLLLTLIISVSFGSQTEFTRLSDSKSEKAILEFDIKINRKVYFKSIYGESPQIAIWVEDSTTGEIRNVYVTHRSGKNDWKGKVYCKVALPFWRSREKHLTNAGKYNAEEINAVTSATSKNDLIKTNIKLDENSSWICYVEVNVAGDYNKEFGPFLKNGMPDTEGNGQPSLVFSGKINIQKGNTIIPKIIGRSHQTSSIDKLIDDMGGIDSASKIFNNIKVTVR